MNQNQVPVVKSIPVSNKLISIGGALVLVPVPQVKILGVVAIGVGLGFEIYDQIQQRRS